MDVVPKAISGTRWTGWKSPGGGMLNDSWEWLRVPFSAEVLGGLVAGSGGGRGGLSPQETLWLRTPHLKQVIFSLISAKSTLFSRRRFFILWWATSGLATATLSILPNNSVTIVALNCCNLINATQSSSRNTCRSSKCWWLLKMMIAEEGGRECLKTHILCGQPLIKKGGGWYLLGNLLAHKWVDLDKLCNLQIEFDSAV